MKAKKMPPDTSSATFCLLTTVSEVIGGKWKMQIMAHLPHGAIRYGELKRLIPECSEKMLIQSLKELEADGLVLRIQYNEVPPRVEYQLTQTGKELAQVITEMMAWGKRYLLERYPDAGVYVPPTLQVG